MKNNNNKYYAFPGVVGAIEFKRKRKPMAAAVRKKISQSLKGKKRRGQSSGALGLAARTARSSVIGAGAGATLGTLVDTGVRYGGARSLGLNRNDALHNSLSQGGKGKSLRKNAMRGALVGGAGQLLHEGRKDLDRIRGRKRR